MKSEFKIQKELKQAIANTNELAFSIESRLTSYGIQLALEWILNKGCGCPPHMIGLDDSQFVLRNMQNYPYVHCGEGKKRHYDES